MVKRYPGKDHTSRACEYGNLVYFSAVSAPEQTSLYEQTAAILREYDSMFAELGLKKSAIVNAFVMLDTQDTEGFVHAWKQWVEPDCEPATTMICGGLEGGRQVQICLWAARTDAIRRVRLPEDAGMLVCYEGVAYFSAQSADGATLTEQTKAVYRRYEALLKENGLRLENILNGNIYCQDITMQDEYEQQWIRWTYPGHKPAGTMVEGRPADRRDLLALGLTFADSPEIADVKRVKPAENCCRYVEYRKTAYFTGHVCLDADAKDLYDHTKGVLRRFCKVFKEEYGLRMDRIISASAYISDIRQAPLFHKAWDEWFTPGTEPACSVIATRLLGDEFQLELALIVADE